MSEPRRFMLPDWAWKCIGALGLVVATAMGGVAWDTYRTSEANAANVATNTTAIDKNALRVTHMEEVQTNMLVTLGRLEEKLNAIGARLDELARSEHYRSR